MSVARNRLLIERDQAQLPNYPEAWQQQCLQRLKGPSDIDLKEQGGDAGLLVEGKCPSHCSTAIETP